MVRRKLKYWLRRLRHGRGVSEVQLRAIYHTLLHREPENQAVIDHWVKRLRPVEDVIAAIVGGTEFASIFEPAISPVEGHARHNGSFHSAPADLERCDAEISRVLLQGSCMMDMWAPVLRQQGVGAQIDLVLLHADLPSTPPAPLTDYAFQIAQVSLRDVLPDRPMRLGCGPVRMMPRRARRCWTRRGCGSTTGWRGSRSGQRTSRPSSPIS
ncbi:MAG: hypothetical protein ABW039_12995 [Sphingobium sp.]